MTDDITRSGSLCNGIIRFELSYHRGARWDDRQGWLDWSGVGKAPTSAFPPQITIAFTGNVEVLREAGCIDERMWVTMQRGVAGGNRGHCGRDTKKQDWSRRRRPTADHPGRIIVHRCAPAPDDNWPFYLPAVTELLRADVFRELRRKAAEKKESREQLARVLALTPEETLKLVQRLRTEAWATCDKGKQFIDALEGKAMAEIVHGTGGSHDH
jgi:hypothetical protein